MGWTLPYYALFLLAFLVYLFKPSWLMLLWLISTPLLAPIMTLFSGLIDFEEQQEFVWGIWGVYNRLFMLILFIEIIKGCKFSRKITPLIAPTVALFAYFVLHNIVTHFNPATIIREILEYIYMLLPLVVLILNKNLWPSLKALYLISLIIFVVQLIVIPLNMQGLFVYSGHYMEYIMGGNESKVMSGTFTRSNMMADYISIIYLFITIDFFSRKSITLLQYLIVTAMVAIILTFAGSKTPFAATLICVFLCIGYFNRKNLAIIGMVVVLGMVMAFFLLSNTQTEFGTNEGLNRIVTEFGDFAKSKKKGGNDETTFKYSTDLLKRYFWLSPVVGHGNAYDQDENAYSSVLDTAGLKTDATLAFYLVEYGVIGLFLFFFFQYRVVKFCSFPIPRRHRLSVVIIIFFFFFIFAFTERGLFDRSYFIFIFVYSFALARHYEESKKSHILLTANKQRNAI